MRPARLRFRNPITGGLTSPARRALVMMAASAFPCIHPFNPLMKLAKFRSHSGAEGVGIVQRDEITPLQLEGGQYRSLFEILEADDPYEVVSFLSAGQAAESLAGVNLLPPIDQQ